MITSYGFNPILFRHDSNNKTLKNKTLTTTTYQPLTRQYSNVLRFGAISGSTDKLGIGETYISTGNPDTCKLVYRGYDVDDLAKSSSYEDVSYLLLYGKLPTEKELNSYKSGIYSQRSIPDSLREDIKRISLKKAGILDKLQAAIVLMKLEEKPEQADDNFPATEATKANKLIAVVPTLIAAIYRCSNGLEPIEPNPKLNTAANILYMITGQVPDPLDARALEQAMISTADHGFCASTMAARTVASTGSDMHSAVIAGIGAFKGPKHGGASEEVAEMLNYIDKEGISPEEYVQMIMKQGKTMPGYGHAMYKKADSRVAILMDVAKEVGTRKKNLKWHNMTCQIMDVMAKTPTTSGKILPPNVDTGLGALFMTMDISPDLFTPLFAASRIAGMVSHITEQNQLGRIYRPPDIYKGPMDLKYIELINRI